MDAGTLQYRKHIGEILHHEITAWVILGASIIITWIGWYISTQYVEQRATERFSFEVEDAKQRIVKRMLNYEQVLIGGVAFLDTLYDPAINPAFHLVSRAEWRNYVTNLQLQFYFPGIQGMGLALMLRPDELQAHINAIRAEGFPNYRIWPEGKRDIYSSIIYLEPFDKRNQRALGYDMFAEPMRRLAMERARDTGNPAISKRVILVQETEQGVQAGFLIYVPFYAKGQPITTVAQRRTALRGYVYSPFRMGNLMKGILGTGPSELGFDIYDGNNAQSVGNLLYQTPNDNNINISTAVKTRLINIEFPGHMWTVIFYSRPEFDATVASNLPILVAIGGFLVDLLLFIITWSMTGERRRVQAKAEAITVDLRYSNQYLELAKAEAECIAIDLGNSNQQLEMAKMEAEAINEDLNRINQQLKLAKTKADAATADLIRITERLELAQSSAGIGTWELVLPSNQLIWDSMMLEIYKVDATEFNGTFDAWKNCVHPDDIERAMADLQLAIDNIGILNTKFRIILPNGKIRIIEAHAIIIANEYGVMTRIVGINFDITERQETEDGLRAATNSLKQQRIELELMAYYDPLTKLPNRALLSYQLEFAMTRSTLSNKLLAICYLDLDGFKPINDQYGHDVGDKLLIEVSNRLSRCMRPGDFLARIGGDEFVLLLEDLIDLQECESVLRRLMDRMKAPYTVATYNVEISASTGVSVFPFDYVKPDILIHHADQAMYQSKKNGRNRFQFFDYQYDKQILAQHDHVVQIEAALEAGQLRLHYQPKVNMRSGKVLGAEALIRWEHPTRGLLQPQDFLPKVDQTDFDVHLGNWVLNEALRQLAEWRKQGFITTVSVNISAQHLQQETFVGHLRDLLQKYPTVLPAQLELEVLETTALNDLSHASRVIHACQKLGLSVAIDDFGTGYSSLIYLKRLPADILKIDQSFVRDMLGHADDIAIIEGIIGLSHAVHRKVIAEGVESEAHGVELLRLGCDLGQGYCIARPMEPEKFPRWATDYKQSTAWANVLLTQHNHYNNGGHVPVAANATLLH